MKTTIKLSKTRAIVVDVTKNGELLIDTPDDLFCLTPDQAGALIFGIEACLDVLDIQRANYGAHA